MGKQFDFLNIEEKIYQSWLDADYFSGHYSADGSVSEKKVASKNIFKDVSKNTSENLDKTSATLKKPFVMALPPPNVTGRLHMGHALNNTIQDLLARYHRMKGFDVVWVPGTDHAGIATQTVVKKMLDSQKIDYRALGREKFIEQVFQWKERYGSAILNQIKKLGCSCDWSRTCFTMDEKLSKAVNHAFVSLYQDGLIYRGERIVNWCPVDRTALSDDEVETKEEGEPGFLYDIAYPVVGESGEFVVVSTTRPETMFGDVAVAVNPSDSRYSKLLGKKVLLPFSKREIPIITDDYVDKNFGTGCLKITPAHDKNDFEIGMRHNLTPINVMDEGAFLNENAPSPFCGLSREKARELVLKKLEEEGLLKGKHHRMIPLGRSYRSKEIIEYRLSKQWFVKMKPLAKKTLAHIEDLHFYPQAMKKVLLHWLENIEDWCISRQIWWGHQIPAWHNKNTGEIIVAKDLPNQVADDPKSWVRESDVLDTWFSSALWPMSIFGWPEKTSDFAKYFPTSTLSTAKDIIFFWVARMCIFSVHFEKKLPFRDVCIHPTIVDHRGKTMSKSKGNGIDPEHIINGATLEKLKSPIYDARPSNQEQLLKEVEKLHPNGFSAVGCDALRYTLIYLFSSQQMMQLSFKDFEEIGRRFTTKLWNAARFCITHINDVKDGDEVNFDDLLPLYDRFPEMVWIDLRFDEAEKKIGDLIETYAFHLLGQEIYRIVWNDFCDWYIEFAKARLNLLKDDKEKRAFLFHLCFLLVRLLRYLHPITPFITEEINSSLAKSLSLKKFNLKIDPLIISPFSELTSKFIEKSSFVPEKIEMIMGDFRILQDIVSLVRTAKKKYQISSKNQVAIYVFFSVSSRNLSLIHDMIESICFLCKCPTLRIINEQEKEQFKKQNFIEIANEDLLVFLEVKGDLDQSKEREETEREIKKLRKELDLLDGRLASDDFLKKAKKDLVESTKKRYHSLNDRVVFLENQIADRQSDS